MSTLPLTFLIPASEVVPGNMGEIGVGLRGQDQFPGKIKDWVTALRGAQTP